MLTIKTLQGTHRMSTQDLLLAIEEAVGNGETSFEIEASGQHDIGGPLWNREGKALRFHVTNPGQRVGSMSSTIRKSLWTAQRPPMWAG